MKTASIHISRKVLGILVLLLCSLASCQDDECDSTCLQGNCIEDSCECDLFYEGNDCGTLSTEKFLGDWQRGDICNSGSEAGSCTVEATTTAGRIRFSPVGPDGQPLFATVNGSELEIPEQTYGAASLVGLGAIDDQQQTITLDYKVEYQGGTTDNCFTTLTR